MLRSIKEGSNERLIEVRESIDFIRLNIPSPPAVAPRHINNLKGQVFVHFYGVVEYTIIELVKFSMDFITKSNTKLSEVRHSILSLALSSDLDSLISVSTKKWDKRFELTEKLRQDNFCSISDVLMPTNGKNFDYNQFSSIWKTLSITEPIFHDVSFRGRLSEVIVFRNKIAHGEYLPSMVGSRFTVDDLYLRHSEVSKFCSYIISVFETYLTTSKFKI